MTEAAVIMGLIIVLFVGVPVLLNDAYFRRMGQKDTNKMRP